MDVSVSAVTNTVAYDFLGRQIATTDGRGNTRQTEYNSLGQRSASIDAIGNRTTYSYDLFGNLATVTDPLGNATVYEYDLRGYKTYEGGATYPVRYTYDVFGNKTTMMTYRDEGGSQSSAAAPLGDVTTWLYDIASGSMTNKVYADGKGPTYAFTPSGRLSRRTWARGIVTDYSYDAWGSLTNTVYSDGTPTIALSYDALGRQTEARDAAGVTTFAYDDFGSISSETVVGVAGTNTIIRHCDNFGRNAGYALNGTRQSTLAYDPATGRLASMLAAGSETPFVWNYLDGSDLKSSLAYPNGLSASWTYDANNQLLQVSNATPTNVISQYDYTYDAVGRRVSCGKTGSAFAYDDIVDYGYNNRSELTNAVASVDSDYRYSYAFDDIGNRESSSERGTNFVYAANQLNQYTEISDSALFASPRETFTPQFDDDGNQTLIKTATGIWQVQCNGENRPVLWECVSPNSSTPTLLSMSYDRMGRRVTKNDQRFIYDSYSQIANFELQTSNIKLQTFIWDPTEPVATRPLVWNSSTSQPSNFSTAYYTHDGNKNVSEVIASNGDVCAHYEYAPFGVVIARRGSSAAANPWRFSSEYADDNTATVYYNYRNYEPGMGRWGRRDPMGESHGVNLCAFINNDVSAVDVLGLVINGVCCNDFLNKVIGGGNSSDELLYSVLNMNIAVAGLGRDNVCKLKVKCESCSDDRSRSGRSSNSGGYTKYDEEFRLFGENKIKILVSICMDDAGRTLGDLQATAAMLNHELTHANDLCRRKKDFDCGMFTLASLNAGDFDGRICTEIHAYAQQNRGLGEGLDKRAIIDGAVDSVLSGCKIARAKHVDDNFAKELESRATRMYDSCRNGLDGIGQ